MSLLALAVSQDELGELELMAYPAHGSQHDAGLSSAELDGFLDLGRWVIVTFDMLC